MDVDALLTDHIDALTVLVRSVDGEGYPTPLERVHGLRKIREATDNATETAVAVAINTGATWEKIGRALGVSPQAAHQKYAAAQNPDPRGQ